MLQPSSHLGHIEGQIELSELLLNSVCSWSPRPASDRHESGARRCGALLYRDGLHLHWWKGENKDRILFYGAAFNFVGGEQIFLSRICIFI